SERRTSSYPWRIRGGRSDQCAHLRVVKQLQNTPLDAKFRQLDTLRNVAFSMKPGAEGVHRRYVGVDRHRPDVAVPLMNHELLKRCTRREARRTRRESGAVVLEGDAIPDQRAGRDVSEVGALFEELIEQRSQRVVHDGSFPSVFFVSLCGECSS